MNRKQLFGAIRSTTKLFQNRKNCLETIEYDREALTHIDPVSGNAQMVDISDKAIQVLETVHKVTDFSQLIRWARAEGRLLISEDVSALLVEQSQIDAGGDTQRQRDIFTPKGGVFQVARLAGIQAAKETARLIPLCHQVALSHVALDFSLEQDSIRIEAEVKSVAQATGVEMEALTAVSVAALTCYDMLKSLKPERLVMNGICLLEKHGGQSTGITRQPLPN